MATKTLSLLHLPDEVLFLICEHLESCRKDLCALACACVRLSEIADRCRYRCILIKSEDQVQRLSKAVQRKPWRRFFIRELVFVPALEDASEIMDEVPFVLELASLVQKLTVELPFHTNLSTAASLKFKHRHRFADLLEAASLVSCVAKPRALQRLRSCKLNFQEEHAKPWSLDTHSRVFFHDTLESLTLVAAEIGEQDVDWLRHHTRLTRLSRLHLDSCGISPSALQIIMSVPQALRSLELTEYDYRAPPRHPIRDLEELQMALCPQEDSLRELHLGLLFQRRGFREPYDLSKFQYLQKLTLQCTQLNGVVHASLSVIDGEIKISEIAAVNTRNIVWIRLPEHPFTLVLETAPGYTLTDSDVRRRIEELGRSLRRPRDSSRQLSLDFETQLVIVRQTQAKWAVPPYLYNEHVPEKVICYDSFASTSTWDLRTDAELETEEDARRLRAAMTPSPDTAAGGPGDFLLVQLNSA